MIKFFLPLLLILLSLNEVALTQEFEVKSFKKDASDLSAVKYWRKDVNNQNCAIIKIRTNLTGLSFDCNLKITGNVEVKTDEVWLYISPKEKRLKFMKEGFLSMDFLIPEPIEPSGVYIVELIDKKNATNKVSTSLPINKTADKLENNMGFIYIKSNPSGAEVTLDGKKTGVKTPFQIQLRPGKYSFELEKELYLKYEADFTLESLKTVTINCELLPNFGKIKVNSVPESQANVVLDEKLLPGLTPSVFDSISAGVHHLSVKKDFYETYQSTINVEPGKTLELDCQLRPTFGILTIEGPSNAEIFIDNQKVGISSYNGRAIEGLHLIEIKKEYYFDYSETIEIKIGKTKELKIDLLPRKGLLSVMSEPPEASVYIDNNYQGETPKIVNCIIGNHDLRIEKNGYGAVNKQIKIIEGKTFEMNEKLINTSKVIIHSKPYSCNLFIDGTKKGKTPLRTSLSVGDHIFRLEKKNHYEETRSININKSPQRELFTLGKIKKEKSYKWADRIYILTSIDIAIHGSDTYFKTNVDGWINYQPYQKLGWGTNFELSLFSKNMRFSSTCILDLINFQTGSFVYDNFTEQKNISLNILLVPLFFAEDLYWIRKEHTISSFVGAGVGAIGGIQNNYENNKYITQASPWDGGFLFRFGFGIRLSSLARLEIACNYYYLFMNDKESNKTILDSFKAGISFTL